MYVTGRFKDIIKCKGHQVSPAELEAILLTHPFVQDAAVTGVPHDLDGEVPRAYVVRDTEENVTQNDVINFMKGRSLRYLNIIVKIKKRN